MSKSDPVKGTKKTTIVMNGKLYDNFTYINQMLGVSNNSVLSNFVKSYVAENLEKAKLIDSKKQELDELLKAAKTLND